MPVIAWADYATFFLEQTSQGVPLLRRLKLEKSKSLDAIFQLLGRAMGRGITFKACRDGNWPR
jgi:hypothetical protein